LEDLWNGIFVRTRVCLDRTKEGRERTRQDQTGCQYLEPEKDELEKRNPKPTTEDWCWKVFRMLGGVGGQVAI
jgi:hypothetical protein